MQNQFPAKSVVLQRKLQECTPDKQADIALELAKQESWRLQLAKLGNGLETAITTVIVVGTFTILTVPGINYHTTQWFQSIEWLKVPTADSATNNPDNGKPAATPLTKVFPLPGLTLDTATQTSGYGGRVDPKSGEAGAMHYGVDLAAETDTPVLATEKGVVNEVRSANDGNDCGNGIGIDFGDGRGVRYCHLNSVVVEMGQTVEAGQEIGKVGSTGKSTGPHLHFEYVENGSSVDPTAYLQSLGSSTAGETTASTPSPLQIELSFGEGVTPQMQKEVRAAVSFWQEKIGGEPRTIEVQVDLASNQVISLDSNQSFLAAATMTAADENSLPTAGHIMITEGFHGSGLYSEQDWIGIIEHEFGHVMGIGASPLWQQKVDKKQCVFLGIEATKAYGGTHPPVECDEPFGHWDQKVDDLMTPTYKDGAQITELTIGALRDVGWTTK